MGIGGRKGVGVINVQILVLIIGLITIVKGIIVHSIMMGQALGRYIIGYYG